MSYGKHPKMETYGKLFTDRGEAVKYYAETVDDCYCDSTQWKKITRREMWDGAIIMVELDSILK